MYCLPHESCRVYQFDTRVCRGLAFTPYEILKGLGFGSPNMDWYDVVFDGKVPTNDLKKLISLFQTDFSDGYRGRSVSVSDVIEFYDETGSEFFYCDFNKKFVKVFPMGEFEKKIAGEYVRAIGSQRYYFSENECITLYDRKNGKLSVRFMISTDDIHMPIHDIEALFVKHGFRAIRPFPLNAVMKKS
jgi:hypothetical protein